MTSDVLALTLANLRYRIRSLLVGTVFVAAALIALFLGDPDADAVGTLAGALVVLVGTILGVHGWGLDAQERRVRLLATLALPRRVISLSRLAAVVCVHLPPAAAALLVSVVGLGTAGPGATPVREAAATIGVGLVWGVALVLTSFFFEEVNVALAGHRIALVATQVVAVVVAVWLVARIPDLGSLLTPGGLAIAVGAVLLFAGGTVVLFQRRRTFDVGVSALHGLPQDWSEERD